MQLTGVTETPRGAMNGIGAAIIAFHGKSLVCWRFAHLHGFTDATSAHVEAATGGRTRTSVIALSPGPRLHHQGCVAVSPALSGRIWAHPRGYYMNIHSKQYPRGAVRGQL